MLVQYGLTGGGSGAGVELVLNMLGKVGGRRMSGLGRVGWLWELKGGWRVGWVDKVLGRIFEPKRDEVIGGWRKLHIEELHNLNFSPSIIRMTKSRRMR
jgi:hypothetical protein